MTITKSHVPKHSHVQVIVFFIVLTGILTPVLTHQIDQSDLKSNEEDLAVINNLKELISLEKLPLNVKGMFYMPI